MPGLSLGLGLGLSARNKGGGAYGPEIAMGAKLIVDFAGSKDGQPFYWLNGTRYSSPANVPGWAFSRASAGYAETQDGRLIPFAAGEPRITDKGLLIEEARTNFLLRSTPTPSGSWAQNTATITDAAGVSPTGETNAARVTAVGTGQNRTEGAGFSNGVAYALSTYVKMETARYVGFGHYNGSSDSYAAFDLQSGTLVELLGPEFTNGAIQPLAGGWFRISVNWTSAGSGSNLKLLVSNNTAIAGNTASGVSALFWNVQVEAGGFPTSPIVTSGAVATRAADSAYITGLGAILGQFRTNKVAVFNANPTDTSNTTKAGDAAATFAVVDDAAALAAAGLSALATSGKVFKLDNTAGVAAARVDFFTSTTGNVNPHTASAYLRGSGSAEVRVNASGAGFSVLGTGYARLAQTQTPSSSGRPLIVEVTAGAVAYFILPQLEEGSAATAVIVTQGARASAGNPFTLVAWTDLPAADGVNREVATANDGNVVNRVGLRRNSANSAVAFSVSNNSFVGIADNAGKGGARVLKLAVRQRANEARVSIDGNLNAAAAVPGPTGMTILDIGQVKAANTNFLNGYVQRLSVFGDVDDAQLTRLAA